MTGFHGHSSACCSIPPIVSKGYQPKGHFDDIGGYRTYVTGPVEATEAIIVIYDIFGYVDQTLQGADILAYGDNERKRLVFIPDWFNGGPCPIEWYPPDTEEKQKKLAQFFLASPPVEVAGHVPQYVQAVKEKHSAVSKCGVFGMCWGGKVVAISVKVNNNPFCIAASVHPAMVEPADADGVKIPFILLASKDEPAEQVKSFGDKLQGPKHIEIFQDQVHGWMAARGDLSDSHVRGEYERGYKTVLAFFHQNF